MSETEITEHKRELKIMRQNWVTRVKKRFFNPQDEEFREKGTQRNQKQGSTTPYGGR